MAVDLSIKQVPDTLADRLRERAQRNHRSLQRELMAIIEQAVKDDPASTTDAPRGMPGGAGGARKTIEEIAAAHRARFPQPITTGPLAVDIVRRDRDSR